MSDKKAKLTLTVDPAMVAQAKKLGVNISEVTEQVLRGYSIKDDGLDWKSYKAQYVAFLHTMDPLLSKYGASVVVGDVFDRPGEKQSGFASEIRYHGTGGFSIDQAEDIMTLDQFDDPRYVLGLRYPGHVLQNLVKELEQAKAQRREQIANLLIAGRIVDAIYQADSKGVSSGPNAGRRSITKPQGREKRQGL